MKPCRLIAGSQARLKTNNWKVKHVKYAQKLRQTPTKLPDSVNVSAGPLNPGQRRTVTRQGSRSVDTERSPAGSHLYRP